MKTLHLNLKRKWFDMILSGEKKEEYREIKPYWCARFLLFGGRKLSLRWWKRWFKEIEEMQDSPIRIIESYIRSGGIEYVNYFSNTFSNGMTPPVPRFEIERRGIDISEGKPEWGAEQGQKYFVLKMGKILNKNF